MAHDPHEQANIRRVVIALGVLLALGAAMWLDRRGAAIEGTGVGTKTLWDWLDLLIIPVVLAIGGFIYNRSEKRLEHQRAEERARLERQATEDNQREAALQTYLDQMGDLLLKGLRSSEPGSEPRDIARVRTLTTVRRLDPARCTIVFRFLHDAGLISNISDSIVNLKEADLSNKDMHETYIGAVYLERANLIDAILTGATLFRTNLTGVDLTEAILIEATLTRAILAKTNLTGATLFEADLTDATLTGADLTDATLTGADLSRADLFVTTLSRADLTGATLFEADLTDAFLEKAIVTQEQLLTCATLRGATLPDGTGVPDDQDFPDGWK